MYEVKYYRTEADVNDVRYFKTENEISEWITRQNKWEPTLITSIEKIK